MEMYLLKSLIVRAEALFLTMITPILMQVSLKYNPVTVAFFNIYATESGVYHLECPALYDLAISAQFSQKNISIPDFVML